MCCVCVCLLCVCTQVRQVVAEVHDGPDGAKRGRITAMLRGLGFAQIAWERPNWAERAGGDNWMMYARRA
jgi:hypothetical protein